MSPREFYNAWIGWHDRRREEWNVIFYSAQYNAMRTAMSKEQQKQIQRDKAPWDQPSKQNKPISGRQVANLLSLISKPKAEA